MRVNFRSFQGLTPCTITHAQRAASQVNLQIESQPLNSALNAWAEQTGYQVLIKAESTAGRAATPMVKGITLHKVYGFAASQISERLGISEETVRDHLSKAARRMAQGLRRFEAPVRRPSVFNLFRRRTRS